MIKRSILAGLTACLFAFAAALSAQESAGPAACLECHDYGEDSPVHKVLAGAHGLDADSTQGRGCLACHGESAAHMRAPRRKSPDVSFGPRWSATAGDQDSACLACHEDGIARNWQHALHMHNNLTCITCHDIHSDEDRVLVETTQAEVCETCHKLQKQGIHGMERRKKRNPPCSTCHNPHDHEDAQAMMLTNRSEGCIYCHDLARMATSDRVSAKAKSYHKVTANPERTCVDCHEGIAHAPADSAPPMHPIPAASRTVTLFYPGMTDSSWLLQRHPGSQPLRQGANCQQCHRGEEVGMGESLADGSVSPAHRQMKVDTAVAGGALRVTLSWAGPAEDAQLSLMWGSHALDAYARGGCFAACHSDMPGMSGDRGQVTDKYLAVSRQQRQQVGQPAIVLDEASLARLAAEDKQAELWRINLTNKGVKVAKLLADTPWRDSNLIQVKKSYDQGRWTVELSRELNNTEAGLLFLPSQRYTFSVALHGAGNAGAKHWVSLPMTLSFGGNDTDFSAE